jgi:ubiquinone/menaquinone biosynthesis C-methylase UbiE
MANTKAVTNKVREFERVLLPAGRSAVVEFFRVFMFLFVLPNVSDETTTRDLHGEP